MAGSQDPDENPVAINVVPMVDVIFCLCVFFMCSFKFKQVEGRFDSWLPKDKGGFEAATIELDEIRVALFWDEKAQSVTRQLGTRRITDDAELEALIGGARDDYLRASKQPRVTIDAAAAVPWNAVVNVMNLCRREQVDRIEFAWGPALAHGDRR